jgi:site-specific DNA recombinase
MDRPHLRKLRELVNARTIGAVIVYDPDRLSRTLGHQLLLAEELERAAVKLLIVSHPMEAAPEGSLFFQMRGASAEYERAKTWERTQRGRMGRVKAGHMWGGNPPYGYRYVGEAHQGHWEVEDQEAAIVRQIFTWSVEGCSIREIARRLTAQGIPTPLDPPEPGAPRRRRASRKRGAYAVWARSSVYEILSNSAYIGCAYHNRRQYRRVDQHQRQYSWRVEDAWIPLAVPAIIDAPKFQTVHERLNRNRQLAARRMKHPYVLRGRWFKCGRCGRSMTAMATRGHRYFRCASHGRHLSGPRCPGTIRVDVAEEKVWDAVMQILSDPDVIR